MVATTDCVEKSKPIPGNKVSKPLMEKKRRARINKCLDQLKFLLESYYSTSIRKRKLEKADILELTVKHLRNLQKIQSSAAALSDFPDYKTGFRSCLANANRYLLMADDLTGSDRWVLSQLSGKLCRSRGLEEGFSTTDSGPGRAGARDEARTLRPPAAGPEEGRTAASGAPGPRSSSPSPSSPSGDGDVRRSSGDGRAAAAAVRARSTRGKSCSHKKFGAVSRGDEAANTQHNVWRPW